MAADPMEALFLGGLGYLIGQGKYAGWDDVITAHNNRLNHLRYFKVIKPAQVLHDVKELQTIYMQAETGYLFGLPDASIVMTTRFMEIALRNAKTKSEGKEAKENLVNLIEWAEKRIGAKKDLAHGFRILRNLIHENTLVKEQDALEAIHHVTEIINLFYPFEAADGNYTCPKCRSVSLVKIQKDNFYLGNLVNIVCGNCQQGSQITIF